MIPLSLASVVVAMAAALIAAVTDIWKYRIHNRLTCPLLVSGLIYHYLSVLGMGLGPSLLGACLGFAPMALMYLIGGMGAGDVKLMAGLGAWLGPAVTVQVLLASWLAAGLYAIVVLLCNLLDSKKNRVRFRVRNLVPASSAKQLPDMVALPDRRRRLIPFGVMILAGLVVTMISTGDIR